MNHRIQRFLRKQKEGFNELLILIRSENGIMTTFAISWIALLMLFVSTDGILVGFVKTVLVSTVVCIISHNISRFFK